MIRNFDWDHFNDVLQWTRHFFIFEYKAGTREMVRRHVCEKMNDDIEPVLVSAALKILKNESGIIYDKNVWWNVGVR